MVRILLEFQHDDSKPNPSTYNYDNTVTNSDFGGVSMRNQVHTESAMRPASAGCAQMSTAQTTPTSSSGAYPRSKLAAYLLTRLFRRLPINLMMRLWNDATAQLGPA